MISIWNAYEKNKPIWTECQELPNYLSISEVLWN